MSIKCPKARRRDSLEIWFYFLLLARTHTHSHEQAPTSRLSPKKTRKQLEIGCVEYIVSKMKTNGILLTSSECSTSPCLSLTNEHKHEHWKCTQKFHRATQQSSIDLFKYEKKCILLGMTCRRACEMHPLQPRSQNIATKRTEPKSIFNFETITNNSIRIFPFTHVLCVCLLLSLTHNRSVRRFASLLRQSIVSYLF